MSDFSIDVVAKLNTKQLESDLKGIESSQKLNLSVNTGKIVSDIQNSLKSQKFTINLSGVNFANIASQFQSSGADAGKSFATSFSNNLSQIKTTLNNSQNTIQNMKQTLRSLQFDSSSIELVTKDLENMNLAISNVSTKINGKNLNISIKGIDDLGRIITVIKQFDYESGRISTLGKTISQSFDSFATKAREAAKAQETLTKSETLSNKITAWMNKNTQAAERYENELKEIQNALSDNRSNEQLRMLSLKLANIQSQAKAAGLTVNSFAKSLKDTLLQVAGLSSWVMVLQKAIQLIKTIYKDVLDVNASLVSLYRVTNLTGEQYQLLYNKLTKSAKEYGATLAGIIQSTANWVKLGFDADTAVKLAEITEMYKHVTDLDDSTAVKNLVTAYKGFQIQLEKIYNNDSSAAIENIADIYDKLGNSFAESAADVGEGLSHAASVLSQSGNSIEESAAMFTGIQEVIQDSSTAGTTLKILALRLRGMKGELLSLDEEVDENVISLSKMQTQILKLTHGKVNIFNDDNTFKSTYEILNKISEIYEDLTDTEQADLLETIAGKNRANGVQALISNWTQVEKALEAASTAEGTAAEENQKYMQGLEGHINALKASAQTLSNTFLDSETVKSFLDFITALTNGANKLVDTFGSLPTVIGIISATLSTTKNFGKGKMFPFIKNEICRKSYVFHWRQWFSYDAQ